MNLPKPGRLAAAILALTLVTGLTGCAGGHPGVALVVGEHTVRQAELDRATDQVRTRLFGDDSVTADNVAIYVAIGLASLDSAEVANAVAPTDQDIDDMLDQQVATINEQRAAAGEEAMPSVAQWDPAVRHLGRAVLFLNNANAGMADQSWVETFSELVADPGYLVANPRFGSLDLQSGFVPIPLPWMIPAQGAAAQ